MVITSKTNRTVKAFQKLLNDKKYRKQTKTFVALSFRIVQTLVNAKFTCKMLVINYDHSNLKRNEAFARKSKINYLLVNQKIYDYLDKEIGSDGICGMFDQKICSDEIIPKKRYLILDHLQNPNNLAGILRTALAFNIDQVFLTNNTVDYFHPQVVKNSLGACALLKISVIQDFHFLINQIKKAQIKVWATVLDHSAKELSSIKQIDQGFAIVFGNEGNGLNKKQVALCNEQVYIKMNPIIDSLNVAMACAIILYHFYK